MIQHTITLPQVCFICGKAADHDEHVTIVANYNTHYYLHPGLTWDLVEMYD